MGSAFQFEETTINDKRVVVLVIPAAEEVPTVFKVTMVQKELY